MDRPAPGPADRLSDNRPDAWYNTVLPLAQWRRQKGTGRHGHEALSKSAAAAARQVLAYLQNAYNNWPVKPSYVLLVGDVDSIGYFAGQGEGNPDTDLNYSLLAGSDYLPDICVSRASVADGGRNSTASCRRPSSTRRTSG